MLCLVCTARYKTKPGLSYHMQHSHVNSHSRASEPVVNELSSGASPSLLAKETRIIDPPAPSSKKITV